MESTELQQAISNLRKWKVRRRIVSISLVAGGLVIVAVGLWGQHQGAQSIADAIESFHDTPAIAIGVVSGITPTFTIARLNVFFGIGLACLGLALHFCPDPRATILLALLDESNLNNKPDER